MREIGKKMAIRGTDIDTFKAITTELTTKINIAKGNLMAVNSSGEDEDRFIKTFNSLCDIGDGEANSYVKKKEELFMKHKKTCELFGLEADSEECKDTPIFLKNFQDFFKNVVECLPAEEKKRGAGASRPGAAKKSESKPGSGGVDMMAAMREIEARKLAKAAAANK